MVDRRLNLLLVLCFKVQGIQLLSDHLSLVLDHFLLIRCLAFSSSLVRIASLTLLLDYVHGVGRWVWRNLWGATDVLNHAHELVVVFFDTYLVRRNYVICIDLLVGYFRVMNTASLSLRNLGLSRVWVGVNVDELTLLIVLHFQIVSCHGF